MLRNGVSLNKRQFLSSLIVPFTLKETKTVLNFWQRCGKEVGRTKQAVTVPK